ncbi:hypothetical protein Taro_026977 [Colocasia esculenta]|uniref:Plant heme peroxidase family profile domain-containing protein n=1 Tax=Colocasia esculenta TaxID=4460 RepID=A0A843VED9_COLES|nr:hypothetical protein [Colocasia esculenta]
MGTAPFSYSRSGSGSCVLVPFFIRALIALFLACPAAWAQLNPSFYDNVCPQALPTIRRAVFRAVADEPRMGASLLRLHFHDCFVNLGGSSYEVQVGRRDARTASRDAANNNIPSPTFNLSNLVSSFQAQGLSTKDLVVLSGAHTVGAARCRLFRNRIYNETSTIDASFATAQRQQCPVTGGDDNLSPLDSSTGASFDTAYYEGLLQNRGLLHSDQELFKGDGGESDERVKFYTQNPASFGQDFGVSMLRMGNIKPLTGEQGEIRNNCRKVN